MSQPLPTNGFKWMKNLTVDSVIKILEKEQARKQKQQGGIGESQTSSAGGLGGCNPPGYIFEVDLEYPSELWDQHNDYPLAPERLNIDGVEKLICHFKPRKNYVVHFVNLRQYLEMGRILQFIEEYHLTRAHGWSLT